jgi:hypothetical protein
MKCREDRVVVTTLDAKTGKKATATATATAKAKAL